MRTEHFKETPLKVRVPRGNDGFWDIICKLHAKQGEWTVSEIDGESNVNAQCIRKYVRLLVAGGFAEVVGATLGGKPRTRFVEARYRLLKSPNRAPRVRPDGSEIPATKIEHLWTAIRNLTTGFTLVELVWTATVPGQKPSRDLAKKYVGWLTDAGYLAVVKPSKGNSRQVWRLKPGMNHGPKPPVMTVVRADAMFDPNIGAFVGPPPIATEVSP